MAVKSNFSTNKVIRFVLTAAGLGIVGVVFGIAGAFLGGRILGGSAVGFGAIGLAIGGILIGYPAGIIVGIILLKKLLRRRGSLLFGIIGGIAGAVITVLLAEPANLNADPNLLFGFFFLIVPILSLVGFNLRK